MKLQTVVEHLETGRRGVVCPNLMSCCSEDEVPVVWVGKSVSEGTPSRLLKEIGPENAKADFRRCGAGRGADCCIFLTAGPGGASCERFSDLRFTLILKKDHMGAQREPTAPFPDCYLVA